MRLTHMSCPCVRVKEYLLTRGPLKSLRARGGKPPQRRIVMRDFPQSLLHGSGFEVRLDPARLLLVFKEPPNRHELEEALARHHLALEEKEAGTPDLLGEVINHTATHYWVRTASGAPIKEEAYDK